MKKTCRLNAVAVAMTMIVVGSPAFGDVGTAFVISGSNTSMGDYSVAPFQGDRTLYIWYAGWDGVNAFEFGLTSTLEIVSFGAATGYENIGTAESPLIVATEPDCVDGSHGLVIAEVLVRDALGVGGEVCFTAAPASGKLCFRRCQDDYWYLTEWTGFNSESVYPCAGFSTAGCRPTSLEKATWGRVKAAYSQVPSN